MNTQEAVVHCIINLVANNNVVAAAGTASGGKFVRLPRAFAVLAWRYILSTEPPRIVKSFATLTGSKLIVKCGKNRF